MDQTSGISEEKRQWMEDVGIKEFKRPMHYHSPFGGLYSYEYIKNTPLETLKEKYEQQIPNE